MTRRVSALVDPAGKVIASVVHPPGSASYTENDVPSGWGLLAEEGQEVVELELPDEEVSPTPGPEFLQALQRFKDSMSS